MDFWGAGKKLPAEFFRIQGRSDFRRGEITNLKQGEKRKESPGPLLPCVRAIVGLPAYLPRPLGVFH